jgi:hypothetical protein
MLRVRFAWLTLRALPLDSGLSGGWREEHVLTKTHVFLLLPPYQILNVVEIVSHL